MSLVEESKYSESEVSSDSDSIPIPPIPAHHLPSVHVVPEGKDAQLHPSEYSSYFNIFVLTSYIFSDVKKKPKSYMIGIFTVSLTITFIILLYSILDLLPYIFLKQAQDTVGESDLVYTARSAENISQSADHFAYNSVYHTVRTEAPDDTSTFVNFTLMEQKTQNFTKYQGITPRWFGVADFSNPETENISTPGVVMILDTEREVEIGLGRDFSKTLLGAGQAFVTRS